MAAAGAYHPTEIPYYEGLIRKTAAMCAPRVQEEYEDIVSIFRIKVWRALLSFNPQRSSMTVQAYVFSCVKNQEKDLLKRKRRPEVYLADQTIVHDPSVHADEVFDEIERELPLIPCTLTAVERAVVVRLYMDVSQRDIALELGLTRSEMERTVRAVRIKMADWRPSPAVRPLAVG
jgi:RNA polymerase sigma factor (sigma-70 family)